MVSPWCENGSLVTYLKEKNPGADRLRLLYEVACGIHYLHSCSPSVVHGDLKGCNILVDSDEHAIITDFGLAKVLEEVAHDINDMPSSLHQGSVRWMAPELMFAMVEDSGLNMGGSGHSAEGATSHSPQRCLPVTRYSDVYAFASVCLEVLTGALPYPNRPDYGIPIDLMRGIKPTRGSVWFADVEETSDLWTLMNQCWESRPLARPTMQEMLDCLNKWGRTVESDNRM